MFQQGYFSNFHRRHDCGTGTDQPPFSHRPNHWKKQTRQMPRKNSQAGLEHARIFGRQFRVAEFHWRHQWSRSQPKFFALFLWLFRWISMVYLWMPPVVVQRGKVPRKMSMSAARGLDQDCLEPWKSLEVCTLIPVFYGIMFTKVKIQEHTNEYRYEYTYEHEYK